MVEYTYDRAIRIVGISYRMNRGQDVRLLLVRVSSILVVGECTSLVFVSTVAVYQNIATERLFIFWYPSQRFVLRPTWHMYAPRPFVLGEPTWRRSSLDWYRDVAIVSLARIVRLPVL